MKKFLTLLSSLILAVTLPAQTIVVPLGNAKLTTPININAQALNQTQAINFGATNDTVLARTGAGALTLTGKLTLTDSLTLNGALTGTPTGGTLNLSALTLTLPATVIGGTSSLQPLDSDLTAIAALTTTANGRSLLTSSALTIAGLGLANGATLDTIGAKTQTGTGNLVLATSPTLTTPNIGAATATSITGPTATNLTLQGGSSGASLVLGQGASGGLTINANAGAAESITVNSGGATPFGFKTSRTTATATAETAIASWDAYNGATRVSFIRHISDGNVNDAGAITLSTKVTGGALAEKARITSTGNLLIGTTTDSGARVSSLKAGTSPASSGTTSTAAFRAFDSNNVALDVGVKSDASPFPGWIQVHDTANQAINYPLSLQGNGSYVTIGTLASATVGNGGLYVGGTAASTSTTSGALQVGGGIGVAGAINAGGQVNASRPFMSTGPIQSNMTSAGGIGFAGGGAYIYSFGADAATVGAFAVQQISSDGSVTRTPLSIATTGTATFSGAVTTGGMLTLPKAPAAGRSFIVTGVDGTGTGSLVIQAGGGSSSWGGTLNLFEAAHATRGGWATVGIGVSNAKFTVNSGGFADGGDVLTVDRTGVLSTTSYHDMTGGIGTPTAGHGQFGGSGAYGAVLAGNGSAYDFGLFNKNGTDVMHVATGGTTVAFSGTAPSTGVGTGALQVTGGIYAGAASVFGSTVTLGANLEMLGGANLRFAGAGGGLFYTSGYGQPISIQSSALNLNTLSGGVTTFGGVSILKNYTVATLPAAASYTYGEAYVSDATQAAGTSIGSAPTGGGSVVRGVYSNGSAWLLR